MKETEKNSDLEKTETGGKLCEYHRDSGLIWEQHLQADSFSAPFAEDTTGEDSGEDAQIVLSDRTRGIIASDGALEREFGEGFDSANSKLAWGFKRVTSEIAELRADFRYGIVLALEQLRIQEKALDDILDRLDGIHETLKNPLLTQARELFKAGMERLQKGLLPEALKAFLNSAEKNETDFLAQLQIGKLYLYGQNETDNVIDLPSAEKHLRLAARYAQSEIQHLPDAAEFCGEAFLHAAIACYAQADEKWSVGDPEAARNFTEQGMELTQNAEKFNPQLAEAFYHHAKFAALLGDGEAASDNLKIAIMADRNYCLKVDSDKDFDGVREYVFDLFESLRQQAKQETANDIGTVRKLLHNQVYQSPEAKQAEAEIQKALEQAESFYGDDDTYFDYLDVLSILQDAQNTFDQIPTFSFQEIITLSSKLSPVFSPDGQYLALKSSDDNWRIYQTDEFKEILSSKHSPYFSPDGRYLSIKSDDIWKIYQTGGFKEMATLNGYPYFSPDGRYLAVKSSHDTCKIYQIDGFKEIATLSSKWSPVFSPDSKYLASGSSYDTWKIYQTDGFKEVATLNSNRALVFSSDGKYLASGSSDDTCKIYQTDGFKEIATLSSKWSPVFSPDGKYLASGSSYDTWKIYRTNKFNEIVISKWSPVFSPDGKYLANGSSDNTCKIYQTDGFKEITTLNSNSSPIFSPDGKYLAVKSIDDNYKIYQTDGFKKITTLSSDSSPVFSPDGEYLAIKNNDDNCKVYQSVRCTISRQEFEAQERRRIEAEREAEQLMEEERRKKEIERKRKREAEEERRKKEIERKRKKQELREYRLKNKLCLECGEKLSFLDKLNNVQYCKNHRR